jgi:hypothetical protein
MMTTLESTSPMSVVDRSLAVEEEVKTMTTTHVFASQYAAQSSATRVPRRARPHGIDRLVMRLSLAMLLWARHRADRGVLTHEQHLIRRTTALALEREQRDAAARIARVF